MRIAYVCADAGVPVFGQKGCSIHVQEVVRALELGLIYKYERRDSNDPDKNFKAHAAGIVLTYRWWK